MHLAEDEAGSALFCSREAVLLAASRDCGYVAFNAPLISDLELHHDITTFLLDEEVVLQLSRNLWVELCPAASLALLADVLFFSKLPWQGQTEQLGFQCKLYVNLPEPRVGSLRAGPVLQENRGVTSFALYPHDP